MADEDQSAQAAEQHGGKGRGFVNQQLGGLDVGDLIMAPIKAAADGQEQLCNKYLNFIMKLAYETNDKGQVVGGLLGKAVGIFGGVAGAKAGEAAGSAIGGAFDKASPSKTKLLKFRLQRPQVAPDGSVTQMDTEIQAPLLSLVPLPALTMDEVLVDFTMDVSDQFSTNNTIDSEDTTKTTETGHSENAYGGGLMDIIGVHGESRKDKQTVVKGQISAHRENTRKTDVSAKYTIRARAVQQPPADGMAKLTDLFNAMIEPISTDNTLMDKID